MEAIAATAISEVMSVYSTAVAPSVFFIKRRKIESISISSSILTAAQRPTPNHLATVLKVNWQVN